MNVPSKSGRGGAGVAGGSGMAVAAGAGVSVGNGAGAEVAARVGSVAAVGSGGAVGVGAGTGAEVATAATRVGSDCGVEVAVAAGAAVLAGVGCEMALPSDGALVGGAPPPQATRARESAISTRTALNLRFRLVINIAPSRKHWLAAFRPVPGQKISLGKAALNVNVIVFVVVQSNTAAPYYLCTGRRPPTGRIRR